MAAVIFTDGARLAAGSWQELEKMFRTDSWNADFETKQEFRDEMARRAWNWSRTAILTEGTCKKFFQSLESAGILRVEEEE